MRRPEYAIVLSKEDRAKLGKFVNTGVVSVKLWKRARVILELDTSDGRVPIKESLIAEKAGVSRQTVQMVKKEYFSKGGDLEAVLQRKKRETPPVMAKITSDVEANILALARSAAPEGHDKWTLRLLAERSVELGYIDAISHTSVSRVLKKHRIRLP
jgi:transposase